MATVREQRAPPPATLCIPHLSPHTPPRHTHNAPQSNPSIDRYLFPSGQPPVSYYGDADFAAEDVMLVHDVTMADDPSVDVTAMLHALPVEVQSLFTRLRKVWMDKVRLPQPRPRGTPHLRCARLALRACPHEALLPT